MKILMEKGNTRRVFLFKKFVIKVAIIAWRGSLISTKENILMELWYLKKYKGNYFREKKRHYDYLRKSDEEFVLRKGKTMQMEVLPCKGYEWHMSFSNHLCGGIMANHQERLFYKKTKNVFVMPTYFSFFFGLVNIQKRGKEITFWDDHDIIIFFQKHSQNSNQVFCDGHSLTETKNFVLDDDNHIKIVDYGNRQVGPFIILNGKNFYNNFKLPK